MPAERFYIDSPLDPRTTAVLEGPELHHLAHVMRIRPGEEVDLVNGKGALAKARLASLEKSKGYLEILETEQRPLPPRLITLAIPFLRPAKLELILEKGTELGADAFWIYPAAHSEKSDLSPHQRDRLHHIAISAMKQCGRLDLPEIKLFDSFSELFGPLPLLYGDTGEAPPLAAPSGPVVFATGPEKGFSPKEQALLAQHGKGVRLHGNILRAETAPLAAAALLNYFLRLHSQMQS